MKLTITSAGGRNQAVELGRGVVVGRDPSCDVVLDDDLVSRRHAQLEVDQDGRVVLRDLGSSNGTFVNGARIEGSVVLSGSERIAIGDAQISLAPEVAPAPAPDAADPMVGTTLGRYRIDAKIDEGAMGAVYLAEHTRLGKRVALKVIGQRLFRNQVARQRFVDESRVVASLDHPNVIPVFDADEVGGELYLAMRYVDGEDLGRLLDREGALDPDRAISVVSQVGAALDAAHARGLVHRDVKPGNILIASARDPAGEGHAFLCDFGITKNLASSGLTGTGQTLGTPNYMAPEQFKGQPVDARTDIYALGCLLYECLTGTPPYGGDTFEAVMYRHLMTPPPAPSARRPGLPPGLDAVIAGALAKDPAERYGTCAEMVAPARAALAGGVSRARTEPAAYAAAVPTVGGPGATMTGPAERAAPPPPPPGALLPPTGAERQPVPGPAPAAQGSGGRGPRSRRVLLLGAGAAVLVAVAVVAVLMLSGGSSGPQTTIVAGPSGTVHDSSVTFRFSATSSSSTFQCSLDDRSFAQCDSPVTYQGLDDGRHSFRVRAVASGGKADTTAASRTWQVDDTEAPDTDILNGPPAAADSDSATFTFRSSEEDSRFECSLDGGSFRSCSSPDTVTSLGDGKHTFDVRATDIAGNTDSSAASFEWTVKAPFPNAAESDLLQHINERIRPSCSRYTGAPLPTGADAEVQCSTSGVFMAVTHFTSQGALNTFYGNTLSSVAHAKTGEGTGCPGDIPSEASWHFTNTASTAQGRLVCFHFQGSAGLGWTYTRFTIYADAFRNDLDDKALYHWWANGTLLPPQS